MISVILCTHNPRPEYLRRTLGALRAQTLPAGEWELLVIDNASTPPVDVQADLAWHPAVRIIREEEIGLTAARLRGIAEAKGDLFVWVDDDNVLAGDYLARAAAIGRTWPMLGVWGCGCYTPEWEAPPAAGFEPYLAYLGVNRAPMDRWSNRAYDYPAMPAGAGLCSRAEVARRYGANVRGDPRRKLLGRVGGQLSACEDFDFALTAIDLGLGTGVFLELTMVHLMPRGRVEEGYLLRLVEGHAYSTVLLMSMRDPAFSPPARTWVSRLRAWRLRRSLAPIDRKIHDARRAGEDRARSALQARPRNQRPDLS